MIISIWFYENSMSSHAVQAKQFFRFVDHTLPNIIIRIYARTWKYLSLITLFGIDLSVTFHEHFDRLKIGQF